MDKWEALKEAHTKVTEHPAFAMLKESTIDCPMIDTNLLAELNQLQIKVQEAWGELKQSLI